MSEPKIDIMIPTLNEADHIGECVRNALKLGPVYVLDSFSKDGTQQIARDAGATVIEHEFVNYSAQKNWGIANLPFEGDWIFILDADERLTPSLVKEVRERLARPDAANGYFVNRVLLFMGREIRHGGLYPSWNLRLFRRGKAMYEDRSVHEHMVCEDPVDYLKREMLHIRRETLSQFIDKHVRYADMESNEWVKLKLGVSNVAKPKALFRNILGVRQWLRREIWPRMPVRPLWRFMHMFVLRLGFLDGRPGWHMARLMMSYEYMISLLYRDKLVRATQADYSTDVFHERRNHYPWRAQQPPAKPDQSPDSNAVNTQG
ncbi:MAG TPA: glycosyltransferase family 2 protein [Tepidisphaeraceae bacterium]|nr:glycosyltransferase family 2 protein [Tepidisphaeraceae bacterium]